MLKNFKYTALTAALLLPATGLCENNVFMQARLSPLGIGTYDAIFGAPTAGIPRSESDGETFTADLGFAIGLTTQEGGGSIILDTELEYFDVSSDPGNDFNRTDLKFTLAYSTPVNLTPFFGYRIGEQGDGFNNDDIYSEKGIYAGLAYRLGAIDGVGTPTVSAAYNDNKIDIAGSDFDTSGVSLRVSLLLESIPLSVNLKYQKFEDDGDLGGVPVDFEEEYLVLSGTWFFWSKVL